MKIDVLIVGLGPAGASTLKNLATLVGNDFKILGIDKRERPGFPVQCGEFMPSPDEMDILMADVPNAHEFFTFDQKYISQDTDRISFLSPNGKIIQTLFDGYTIHRGKWNEDLIRSAKNSGAEVWTSSKAVSRDNNTIWISRNRESPEPIEAKIVVGADGARSHVARWANLEEKRSNEHFVFVKQHVMTNIVSSEYNPLDIQMIFGREYAPGAYAWIIPKGSNSANVGVGIRSPVAKGRMTVSKALNNLISKHPFVSRILKDAVIESTIGGLVPVGLPYKKTVDVPSSTLLIGDAACQVVSSVGGGIPPSMVAGSIAANEIYSHLVQNTSLQTYESKWREQLLPMFTRAYKIRHLFDQICYGSDRRVQWYLNKLSPSDVGDVVHCKVPWKVKLSFPFIPSVNKLIK
jgi:geranylgeranyl reductase family protein